MTFFGMALLAAIGTVVLAMFAVVTAWYARKAFREQSREVRAIEQQVKDGQEVAKRQADLLKVQSDQLELQQRQFDEDQTGRRRAQAAQIFILIDGADRLQAQATLRAVAHNTSSQPVYDLWVRWRTDDGEFGTPGAKPELLPHLTESFEQIWTVDAGISGHGRIT